MILWTARGPECARLSSVICLFLCVCRYVQSVSAAACSSVQVSILLLQIRYDTIRYDRRV